MDLNTSNFAGHNDWRVPTTTLLKTLLPLCPCGTPVCAYSAFDTGCMPGCTITTCSCTDTATGRCESGCACSWEGYSLFYAAPPSLVDFVPNGQEEAASAVNFAYAVFDVWVVPIRYPEPVRAVRSVP